MAKLVIVESPSKAKSIQKYLGKEYKVVSSKGHVRDLPAARLSVDIDHDFAPKYAIIKKQEGLVKELKELAEKSDSVILAADPDREGEAISWHIATILGLSPEDKNRVKFNEINKKSVTAGIAKPEKIDMGLVNAQQARRILDRLVGYTLSPFVSQKIHRGLSAGRVQSVAVRLIVDREDEIRAFIPEEYWSLDAKMLAPSSKKAFDAQFIGDETGKIKITNKEQADSYLKRIEGADFTAVSVKRGVRNKQPAPPFTTSTLQQEASRKLNFQAKKTMKVAQELYEGIDVQGYGPTGLITYMRTDSLRISEEARAAGNNYIKAAFGPEYLPDKPRYYKSRANAQDGHEAIRPTSVEITPEKAKASLTPDQYKLYNLIWKRFLASLMAACVQNTVKVEINGQNAQDGKDGKYVVFGANGYSVKFEGYTKLYVDGSDEDEEEEGKLPEINVGDKIILKEFSGNQHFTQPPARYTEASLIKALEETGVGRPSTYATIISTITAREYVKREKKLLVPTELGETITKLLKEKFPKIVNVKFTAGMEDDLDAVENGDVDYIKMLHAFYDEYSKTLEKAKADMKGVKIQLKENETDEVCEKCGRKMVIKVGRFGKFLACSGYPECKNTKPLVLETGGFCPVCGGKVVEKKSRKGHTFFGCSNYPSCNFMTWDKPTADTCPQCGKTLFKRKGGVLVCLNEGCGYEAQAKRKSKK